MSRAPEGGDIAGVPGCPAETAAQDPAPSVVVDYGGEADRGPVLDVRWRPAVERLSAGVRLQREMLGANLRVVESDGRLVYTTCILEPDEDEAQVEAFLGRHPDFERELADPAGPGSSDLPVGWEELRVPERRRRKARTRAARLRGRAS